MKKLVLASLFFFTGCTYYVEKQSEAVSQNVYATNESLGKARVDLAYFYSNETTKFIRPPKNPIAISAIYETNKELKDLKVGEKTRVVIVPEQYKGDKVVVVGSADYQELLKDREIKKQLELDNALKEKQIKANNDELIKQKDMRDKMISDLNHLQAQVYKKDATILKLIIALALTWLLIIGYIYLRMNRMFAF